MSAPAGIITQGNGAGLPWFDGFDPRRVGDWLDIKIAYQDVKEAHAYVTNWLEGATDPTRQWNLTAERKRLSAIAWALKRRLEHAS